MVTFDELCKDKDYIKNNLDLYPNASKEVKNDRDLALRAVRYYGWFIRYVSYNLRQDREIVLEAVKNFRVSYCKTDYYKLALPNIPDEFADDKEIVIAAISNVDESSSILDNWMNIKYVSDRLKNDPEILLEIFLKYPNVSNNFILPNTKRIFKSYNKFAVNLLKSYVGHKIDFIKDKETFINYKIDDDIKFVFIS